MKEDLRGLGSRRLLERERAEVGDVGGAVGQAEVGASAVLGCKVAGDARGRGGDRGVGMKVDLPELEGAPEPLDEEVVAPGASAVHAHLDAVVMYQPGEVGAR